MKPDHHVLGSDPVAFISTALATDLEGIIDELGDSPGPLLPVLHAIQDRLGHVPTEAVALVAQALNLSRAEVHGVLSYYHHFRTAPPARHVLQVCRAESCRSCGGEAIHEHATRLADARADLAVEPVYCLGMCAASPAVQLDDRIHAGVTPQALDRLVAQLAGDAQHEVPVR